MYVFRDVCTCSRVHMYAYTCIYIRIGPGLLCSHDACFYPDDVVKWKHFPRYWPFVRGIHRSPMNSSHKGQCHGALIFPLIYALNKRLSIQSRGCWFETPSRSLRRHRNDYCSLVTYFDKVSIQRMVCTESSPTGASTNQIILTSPVGSDQEPAHCYKRACRSLQLFKYLLHCFGQSLLHWITNEYFIFNWVILSPTRVLVWWRRVFHRDVATVHY